MLLVELGGLTTGPHVCYRFWKNGKQVDALKLNLPGGPMNSANKSVLKDY
jgi:murein DD-endopeptidase MepM/ murein hydrolase activator NlpD